MLSLMIDRILMYAVEIIVGIFELLILAAFTVAVVVWIATMFNVVV